MQENRSLGLSGGQMALFERIAPPPCLKTCFLAFQSARCYQSSAHTRPVER